MPASKKSIHGAAEELKSDKPPEATAKADGRRARPAQARRAVENLKFVKGFDTPERPHRRSYLEHVPDHIGTVG